MVCKQKLLTLEPFLKNIGIVLGSILVYNLVVDQTDDRQGSCWVIDILFLGALTDYLCRQNAECGYTNNINNALVDF